MSGLRVVVAEGDPRSRGRRIGRELGQMIEGSIAFYHEYFDRRGVHSRELQDLLAPYLVASETHLPGHTATIKAMAEGAMVPVWELFAVNAFEELEPLLQAEEGTMLFLERKEGQAPRGPSPGRAPERCSTFTVAGAEATLLGHNEYWLAGDTGNVALVVEAPDDGSPVVASPTVVCCLPAVGMSARGGAQGIQSLTASDDGVGVPRVLVSRHALEAANREDALHRAATTGRAGGYGHTFAFAGGDTFTIETSAGLAAVVEGPGPHTNHYLAPEMAEVALEPSEGSRSRLGRLESVLRDRPPSSPEDVMAILRDHDAAPQAVCLHPDEAEGDEASAVVFSMVCDVEHGRMWVAPGNPCEVAYEEVDLAGIVR